VIRPIECEQIPLPSVGSNNSDVFNFDTCHDLEDYYSKAADRIPSRKGNSKVNKEEEEDETIISPKFNAGI
jgi:hypothetical protein